MNRYLQNSHPYNHRVSNDEYKDTALSTRRRVRKTRSFQDLLKSCENPSKTAIESPNKLSSSTKIGKYVLHEIDPETCLCKAVNVNNAEEYLCRVVDLKTYREVASKYSLVGQHENINDIKETMFTDRVAYLIFERSFSDLHSYLRSKKRLAEEEACRLFKQIVSVVDKCHDSGILIRDLKLRKFVFKSKNS